MNDGVLFEKNMNSILPINQGKDMQSMYAVLTYISETCHYREGYEVHLEIEKKILGVILG